MSEQRLIQKIKQGDREALDSLIKEHYQAVFAYFYRNTRDYHLSNDLTQEVFVKLVSAIDKYENMGKFKAWLFTVASNTLKNHWKYQNIHPQCELDEEIGGAVEDGSVRVLDRLRLEDALAELPIEQREAVILKYYHDMKIRDIAKMTGVTESTVKSRLNYGLQKLNQAVKER